MRTKEIFNIGKELKMKLKALYLLKHETVMKLYLIMHMIIM